MNIIVVGGSRGIGLELATQLTGQGHDVFNISRSTGCDARSRQQLTEVRGHLEKTWAHVDALICCAANLGPIGKAISAEDDWLQSVEDNLGATLLPIQVFAPMLRLADNPKVICFSGGGATRARPMFSAYACAKTAVVRLAETIAAEEPWLQINAVAPGRIDTDLTREEAELLAKGGIASSAEVWDRRENRDRLAKLFALIDWLLSKESNGISGRLIAAQWDTWTNEDGKDDWGYLRRVESRRAT